jgi:DNA repair protein RecN (Recombination protein N)
MITSLDIRYFAVVESLQLDFYQGMTVMTGETGAGKSILIDALQLALGERADPSIIREGSAFAEISASYDISNLSVVRDWLVTHDLGTTDDNCVVRRIINKDGRSKAYINGRTVPLNQLRELGWHLVNIHGQHQHQLLLKPEHQRTLLDCFANHDILLTNVSIAFEKLQVLKKEMKVLTREQGQPDKLAFLQYQIAELAELQLQENELYALQAEQKKLAHIEHWQSISIEARRYLKSETSDDVLSLLYRGKTCVEQLKSQAPELQICDELLSNAVIQLEEAVVLLTEFNDNLKIDPTRLQAIEERLSAIHQLARKNRIQPEALIEYHTELSQNIDKLLQQQTRLGKLKTAIQLAEQEYQTTTTALSNSRKKTAVTLENLVTTTLKTLEMPKAIFKIDFTVNDIENSRAICLDDIEFLVSTNPGLSLQPLRKIASGGELSRISLAIQVITAKKMTTPTLIFDEVDAGISGKTAETVGKLLKQLAKEVQILCVTHLPQIAALGHQHYQVSKNQTDSSTSTDIHLLNTTERITELARMVGGATITEQALSHAKTLLELA